MSNKKQAEYTTISREKRIELRAKRYAAGELSLDEFVSLERLDDSIIEIEAEAAARNSKSEALKLRDLDEEEKAIKTAKAKKAKKLDLSIEEFNKLPLSKQQKLYEEFPAEVKALIESNKLTPLEKHLKDRGENNA